MTQGSESGGTGEQVTGFRPGDPLGRRPENVSSQQIAVPIDERAEFGFERFAKMPEHMAVNRGFVERSLAKLRDADVNLPPGLVILDDMCGTGDVTEDIAEELNGIPATIIGYDNNPASLAVARRDVRNRGETSVLFMEGDAMDLQLEDESVDVVFICNAIHEIAGEENKFKALAEANRVLRPEGLIFINSTFPKEAYPDDARMLYGRFKANIIKKAGGERDTSRGEFEMVSIKDYVILMNKAGFQIAVEDVHKERVELSKEAVYAISSYGSFIAGGTIDIVKKDTRRSLTLREGMLAMIGAVALQVADYKRKNGRDAELVYPRYWFEFSGVKIGSPQLPEAA